jgi:cyclophilin family peptidyl-prolyl cis-trans isomerase
MKKIIGLIFIIIPFFTLLSGCLITENEGENSLKINYFIAEPSIIKPGEYTNLSWNVSGAETVKIDHGIGITLHTGTTMVQPFTNITYSLIAQNNSKIINKIVNITVMENIIDTNKYENKTDYENETYNGQNDTIEDNNETEIEDNTTDNNKDEETNPIVTIYTSLGTIKVKIYQDKLPDTCKNFIDLINIEFYEGMIFHRVKDDFMIQGGTYTLDGTLKESPYGPIALEIHPDVQHVDGAISMARPTNPDSTTSGFFICDGSQPSLDGEYAVFGVVIEGIDVVRAIANVDHDGSFDPNPGGGEPLEPIIIKSIVLQD